MKIIGVIPARYGSKRFPGKPLALINGKPMIQWVYEKASKSKYLERLIVATDDVRIMRKVWSFGGEAMLTSLKSKSGTDRTAEVCKKMAADVIVNIQGDEPLISYKTIDLVVEAMKKDQRLLMATAAIPLKSTNAQIQSENIVKVVLDKAGNALYFSRYPIPYKKNKNAQKTILQHCGLYAFRKNFLLRFAKWKQTPLEMTESLEQLRALERGTRIKVIITRQKSFGVDTKTDLEKVKKML
ncbi:MAG: 3-deoxy-manno-octulosonate cytidylyltransferase [Elusimicrobia bacterium RIFCSPLOWO2_02_FULL_39_32]|nr:MAG: 3-deoxy-manno-octulosonate cytidylyltransferase [Elusimicrobia bacterium GWA2_38_7]OGR79609.1 MAG: 3-deoxy-manno-octulosonate cytidylyltransferase [Elusimicrobia bacterium RIFCSPHIGHO2_02_FULL_39_36]OGR92936.1 MAG: 3-deoxy-manno-octulosonate cytidylyltransferase [Elusimicrobia bacterium RIFCSPLOWO2_02_FULL_39_32]OGR99719.1 MAG: 3-deoxy-manno-octulosonate cytidylyltransferase [Elusimicrobia bacterium RIFCSPLOWO2_12_FULL_39_28]